MDDKLNALRQISQRKLVDILESIPGLMKDLIIEQKLMKILDSFVGVTVLKYKYFLSYSIYWYTLILLLKILKDCVILFRRCGVDKIYKLEEGLKPSNSQRIFLVSNDLIACKRVLDQIQSEISHVTKPHVQVCHHLLVMPFVPAVLHNLVEEEGLGKLSLLLLITSILSILIIMLNRCHLGLAELVTLRTLSVEFIKLDGNVLSLENPMFIDLYYHKDISPLRALARNLWSLQLILGSPRLSLLIGKHSQQVGKLMESMVQCLGSSSLENEVGALIVMDRDFDLATTLLTPVTYSGLLNEVVEVNVGTAVLGKSQVKLDPDKDQIYGEVRDTPCSEVFPIIHGKAKSLKCILFLSHKSHCTNCIDLSITIFQYRLMYIS